MEIRSVGFFSSCGNWPFLPRDAAQITVMPQDIVTRLYMAVRLSVRDFQVP